MVPLRGVEDISVPVPHPPFHHSIVPKLLGACEKVAVRPMDAGGAAEQKLVVVPPAVKAMDGVVE